MDNAYKNDFKTLIASDSIKDKYRYEESQLYLSTFMASFGYCNKLSAFDMTYAVQALLENCVSDSFIISSSSSKTTVIRSLID